MSTQHQKVRVRIAPSPTGYLHLGTARTAVSNYLYAKHNQGRFVFRLEDTDEERSNDAYTQDIIKYLKWLGINWDEGPDIGGSYGPYRQTQKEEHYRKLANELVASKKAYFCYATQDELAKLKEDQQNSGLPSRYDNRGRFVSEKQAQEYEAEGRIPCIRLIVEEPRVVSWNDLIKGPISINTQDLGGDPVLVKSSGMAVYNFAVVVDDLDMEITDVIRGEDHIHNTAKQILIYEALGKECPRFAHAALIFDAEKQKLSKRKHGEFVHISKYEKDGYLPQALFNYLTQMSFTMPNGQEIFTKEEAIEAFDLAKVSKSPAIFDLTKLNWFNNHYLRALPANDFENLAKPYLKDLSLDKYEGPKINQMLNLIKDGLNNLSEIKEQLTYFEPKPIDLNQSEIRPILDTDSARKILRLMLENVDKFKNLDSPAAKSLIDEIGLSNGFKKNKELYMPIRVALTGRLHGPDLSKIINILSGSGLIQERLENALNLTLQIKS